jgi:molybdate transport system regulatory protein
MEARFKLWLEVDGALVMSDYRAVLLEHVRRTGSLRAAADALDLSYRRAWGKVRELEQSLGYPVMHSEAGGHGGGKSQLTAAGEQLLEQYEAFQAECSAAIASAYARCFPAEVSAQLGV